MIVEGYTPFPWQREVHDYFTAELERQFRKRRPTTPATVVVKSPRQVGKSMMIENELIRFALTKRKSVSICVSPTLQQVRKIFQDICEAGAETKLIKKKNDTLLELEFVNRSKILFKSAEQKDSLRGYTVSGLLAIDEAAYMADDVFSLLLPMVNVSNAPILMCSTPRFKSGFFFNNYALFAVNAGHRKRGVAFDFNRWDLSQFLDKDKKEYYKSIMPENQYITEIEGNFLDDDANVFKGVSERFAKVTDNGTDKIIVGIDWGSGTGGDYTVLSALNEEKKQIHLDYFNDKDTNTQITYIAEWLNKNKARIRTIVAEANSIGLPMINQLKQRLERPLKIENFDTTNKSKGELVTAMQVAVQNGDITLKDDDFSKLQFQSFAYDYHPNTQKITYGAPQGLHDDVVMATMLSLKGFDYAITGNYIIR